MSTDPPSFRINWNMLIQLLIYGTILVIALIVAPRVFG
jgi:hypothetical protein